VLASLRSNAIAYLALFLALGGGTAVAVSGALKADSVDGLSAAKFRQLDDPPVAPGAVLELAGMRIRYGCVEEMRKRGTGAAPQLDLRTTKQNAAVTLSFTSGVDGAGESFHVDDPDLDPGGDLDLDQGRPFGVGTVTYSRPNGRVVTLSYGFEEGTECFAHGVALGG
jgi:hypothetical protein